jgi:UDP-N-acetylglucosamine--N-acetylmuramyl-(pentapeptide) pyrophosphoryl-undecaprenol N-acetylglucosamine transferase
MRTVERTIMIMAGGTGGHVFPGLAVADHLRERGWNVIWLGSPAGMEAKLVPSRGYAMAPVQFSGLRGKGLVTVLLLPLRLLRAFWQALRALRAHQPDVVLGMGGYVAFPGGMMASLLNRPLVIHEQNSVAGLTNRVLARLADRVLSGFPGALPDAEAVGNPVRADIATLPDPVQRFSGRTGPLQVLVIGGSLGAAALNDIVPQALALLPSTIRPHVRHQSGAQHTAALRDNYQRAGVNADTVAFIDDMAGAYSSADLVICRAGALTVAELAAAGVASILVPFPHAVDDHQTGNARYLTDAGAAVLLQQKDMTAGGLAALINSLNRDSLLSMASKARAMARADATARVAQICEELAA